MCTWIPHRVVAGFDGSADSSAAVDLAANEAAARKAPLVLLGAQPPPDGHGPDLDLSAITRRVCHTWPGLVVMAHGGQADLGSALIDNSRGAAMVVVGRRDGAQPRTSGSKAEPGLNAICRRVAAHALCPTLITSSGASPTVDRPVMLLVDLTSVDDAAIGFAFEEAAVHGHTLRAVHIWSNIPDTALGAVSPFAYDLNEARAGADRLIAEAVAGWADKYPDVTVTRMPLFGVKPAWTLLRASTDAGVIVLAGRVGPHGMGLVARTVIEYATCPVAAIR